MPEPPLAPVPGAARKRRLHVWQSRLIQTVVSAAVVVGVAIRLVQMGASAWKLALFSLAFGALAFGARAATPPAAALGAGICFILSSTARGRCGWSALLPALVALVVLTTAATRFRRSGKERAGLAERRTGRRAAQVAANLGVAALCALAGQPIPALAALAEAAADTVASEIGQAVGGRTVMLTTLRAAAPGTDGALSLAGTAAGCAGALLVAVAGARTAHAAALAVAAGVFGLLFDSLLGATLERRGLLGNDAVNLFSTAAAALLAYAAAAL